MKKERNFFKVVCIDENNPFEYRILEDFNCNDLESVHEFVLQKLKNIKGQNGYYYHTLVKCKLNSILSTRKSGFFGSCSFAM